MTSHLRLASVWELRLWTGLRLVQHNQMDCLLRFHWLLQLLLHLLSALRTTTIGQMSEGSASWGWDITALHRHHSYDTNVTMGWISARGRMQVRSGDCHRWDEVRWSETLSLSVLRSHAAPMTSSPAQQTVENTSIITYYITVTSSGLHQSGTNGRHCIRQVGRKRKESRHHHQTRRHDDWKHATGSRCKVGLKCGHAHPWDKMSLFHLYLKAHSASKVSTAPFPCSWSQWVNEAMLEQINSPPILQFLYHPVEAAVSQSLHC